RRRSRVRADRGGLRACRLRVARAVAVRQWLRPACGAAGGRFRRRPPGRPHSFDAGPARRTGDARRAARGSRREMTPWASGTWWNPYAGLPVAIQVGFVIALLITLLSLTQLVVLRVKARTARRMLARIASSPDAL